MFKLKKTASLVISLCMASSLVMSTAAFSYEEMSDFFSIENYEITQVGPETNHINLKASDAQGKQNINAVEFNPKNPYTSLRAGKSAGYVYSTQTVNTIANNMSDTNGGDTAIAAINGDFFTFGVGVPHGVFIDDGIILSTPPQYYAAFGLTYDNEPFIVRHGTILDIVFRIEEALVSVSGINTEHKSTESSLVLYTSDYARGTKTGGDTFELRCRVNSGEVRHGDTINFTVEEINDAEGNTPLGEGYVVLSAKGAMIDELKKLSVGDTREITFRFNEFWSNVKFAVGGIELLLQNGEIYSRADKANQPRTSIGIRDDGTVVMATFDGRQKGTAVGMTYETAAEAMLALGCTHALNLDGGGSTTFVLRQPGSMTTAVVNNISGSSPRQVANALVLMNTAPTGSAEGLTVLPRKRTVLAGGEYSFSANMAYDRNFKPCPVPGEILWESSSFENTVSDSGVLTATVAETVTVTAQSGRATGYADVEIVDRVDEIRTSTSEITARPGETLHLTASAILAGKEIEASKNIFSWTAPEILGSFSETGTFTLSESAVSGKITVSYGDVSAEIDVFVDQPPVTLSGFEDDAVTFIPCGISTKTAPNSKIETDLDFVHDGESSLKVYYNFLNTDGDVGAYYMVSLESTDASAFTVNNTPKKLGLLVYGDASGTLLRSIIEDADGKQHYITYGKIEHTGWKYMEAPLPEELTAPFFIKAPVNLVANPGNLTHGCLYFDRLRAVYTDVEGEDLTAPEIVKAWPDENMLIYGKTPSIGIILADDKKAEDDAGIDPESIALNVNGWDLSDYSYDAKTGKISYTVKLPLKNGFHTITLRARDYSGNLISKNWRFEVR